MRIGIIGLQHESNTFIDIPTTMENFRNSHILSGQEVRDVYADSNHEVGGFFSGLAETEIEAVPVFMAWTLPTGIITKEAVDELMGNLEAALNQVGPLDGILVAPHGAAVSESIHDLDGHLLSWLRNRVGAAIPIICTLDLHANLSEKMVESCDAIVAYRTNPHIDQFNRGVEAAQLISRTLRGEIKPTLSSAFPPIAINIECQDTSHAPCLPLYQLAAEMMSQPSVLSVSILLGFPYADVKEMGSSVVVVTDNDPQLSQSLADNLASVIIENREELRGSFNDINQSLDMAESSEGTTCLLDMGDNIGGGGPADGTLLLEAAYNRGTQNFFCCLYDPESVKQAEVAGIGSELDMILGGKHDERNGPSLKANVRVMSLHEGQFTDNEVRHGGQTYYDMGRTAVVMTDRGQTVMLTSRRIAPYSIKQLTSCGIKVNDFKMVVAKGVCAPVAAYEEYCRQFIRVDSPGVTRANMTALKYKNRRIPLFPFESIDDYLAE